MIALELAYRNLRAKLSELPGVAEAIKTYVDVATVDNRSALDTDGAEPQRMVGAERVDATLDAEGNNLSKQPVRGEFTESGLHKPTLQKVADAARAEAESYKLSQEAAAGEEEYVAAIRYSAMSEAMVTFTQLLESVKP